MKLTLTNDLSKTVTVEANITDRSTAVRVTAALKKFVMFFAMAIAAIFIPVLHFVLMPALLLLGIFVASKTYSLRHEIRLSNETTGLVCRQAFNAAYSLGEDRRITCAGCSSQYLLEPS